MPREEIIRNVPAAGVGEVVQEFVNAGAREVRAIRNASGSWDITARFD